MKRIMKTQVTTIFFCSPLRGLFHWLHLILGIKKGCKSNYC